MSEHDVPFLRETLLFLALAGVLIPLLQRLHLNQVVGFLAAGAIFGPYGFGALADQHEWLRYLTFPRRDGVSSLAQLGVVFLMFLIGVELSLERIAGMRRLVFGAGVAQVLACSAAIGAIAHAFGNAWTASLVLGLVLSLSSTAFVTQLLTGRRSLDTALGRSAFAILMLQDLAVVPILVLVDVLAQPGGEGVTTKVAWTFAKSFFAVAAIFLVGRRVLGPLFRALVRRHQPDVFMALTLLAALSIGGATAAAGLSMALGALLAGLLLSETEYRHEIEVTVEPFKGLLMGLFFMAVGMSVDPRAVLANPVAIAGSVAGLVLLKAALVAPILRASGLTWGQAVEGGLMLGQGGEFAFIVVGAAAAGGLLSGEVAQFMLLVVSLSLLATPLVATLGARLGRRIDRQRVPREAPDGAPRASSAKGHVVIAGFGRVGRLLADVLARQGSTFVAIEHDARLVAQARAEGLPVYFGNASHPELLRRLGTAHAAAIVITMDRASIARRTVQAVRRECPALPIFARSRDEAHAEELLAAGATEVVPETLEAGLQLATYALLASGLPDRDADAIVDVERQQRTHRMIPRPADGR